MTKTQVYEEDKKEIFSARIVSFDLQNWNGHIVMVNREQANEYGHALLRELCFLTIHGILHLLGYDHMEKEDEEVMFGLQERILSEYGIKR